MLVVDRPLPQFGLLVERLTVALDEPRPVEILERTPQETGSFPKEVVHCRLHDGQQVKLFCKYSAPRFEAFGHRRGIVYETAIYERILAASGLSTLKVAGSFHDEDTGEAWLVLPYLVGGTRSTDRWSELDLAARWLGDFHRIHEGAERDERFTFLIRYDRPYYEGWAARTADFSVHLGESRPWLRELCAAFSSRISELVRSPQTVVHGEYTVHNVMMKGPDVYPVDWESAAVGFGEVDLTCLLDNCTDDVVETCTRAYSEARWPGGPPGDLSQRFLSAELYLHLRWLGEQPSDLTTGDGKRRLARLKVIAHELDIAGARS